MLPGLRPSMALPAMRSIDSVRGEGQAASKWSQAMPGDHSIPAQNVTFNFTNCFMGLEAAPPCGVAWLQLMDGWSTAAQDLDSEEGTEAPPIDSCSKAHGVPWWWWEWPDPQPPWAARDSDREIIV